MKKKKRNCVVFIQSIHYLVNLWKVRVLCSLLFTIYQRKLLTAFLTIKNVKIKKINKN